MAELGGVGLRAQVNYEAGERKPDSDYIEAVGRAGVDVLYLLTDSHAARSRSDGDVPQSPAVVAREIEPAKPYLSPLTAQTLRAIEPLLDYCNQADQDLLLTIARHLARKST